MLFNRFANGPLCPLRSFQGVDPAKVVAPLSISGARPRSVAANWDWAGCLTMGPRHTIPGARTVVHDCPCVLRAPTPTPGPNGRLPPCCG